MCAMMFAYCIGPASDIFSMAKENVYTQPMAARLLRTHAMCLLSWGLQADFINQRLHLRRPELIRTLGWDVGILRCLDSRASRAVMHAKFALCRVSARCSTQISNDTPYIECASACNYPRLTRASIVVCA